MAIHRIPDSEQPKKVEIIYSRKPNSRRNWALSVAWILGASALVVTLLQNPWENPSSWSTGNSSWEPWAIPKWGLKQISSQNGSLLVIKKPPENQEEVYVFESLWKSDAKVVEMMNHLLARKDKAAFLKNVAKMPREKQLLLLEAIKEFWLLRDAVENLRFFNAISKADMESFLFQGMIPSTQQFRDIIIAMKASDLYSDKEIIQLFSEKNHQKHVFSSLDVLIPNPFEYLRSLFWTENQNDLGSYYSLYKGFLTPEERSQLEEKMRMGQIWIPGEFYRNETERIESMHERIKDGNFAFLDKIIKPDDTINKVDLLAKMLTENDYLSILENSAFLWLQPYQILEYSRAALRMQMGMNHGWWRFTELIWRWIIPEEVLGDVLRLLEWVNVKYSVILSEQRLLQLYGTQRVYQELLATKSYITIVNSIFILRPTKDQAEELTRTIINNEDQYSHGIVGTVFQYIDSLK